MSGKWSLAPAGGLICQKASFRREVWICDW